MDIKTNLLKFTKQIFPTGRSFRMPENGVAEALNKALIRSEYDFYLFAAGILNSILPDNDDFTDEDADLWEARLAMLPSTASLTDRKSAILRKIAYPGNIIARQHYLYIQGQLQYAGFNVYVHEYQGTAIPASVFSESLVHGITNFGIANHDQPIGNIVANYIDPKRDQFFSAGGTTNLKSCIFIGGETYPNTANVDAVREKEFRELILRLKPAQSVAFLMINYI